MSQEKISRAEIFSWLFFFPNCHTKQVRGENGMNKETLRIDRVIGNNVILALQEVNGREYVLMGKGLGFAGKAGERIAGDDSRIEKRFRLDDPKQMVHYHAIMDDIDPEVIRVTEQIITE